MSQCINSYHTNMGTWAKWRNFADSISKCTSLTKMFVLGFKFQWSWFTGPTDNNTTLVLVMAWRRQGDKLIPKPISTKTYDVIWCHESQKCVNMAIFYMCTYENVFYQISAISFRGQCVNYLLLQDNNQPVYSPALTDSCILEST